MKILLIKDTTKGFTGGIKKHCTDLNLLFSKHPEIEMEIMDNVLEGYSRILKKKYFNFKSLCDYIHNSQCDIVHIHGFMSIGVLQAIIAAKKNRKRIVYSPHFHPFKHLNNPFLGKCYFYLFLKPQLKYIDYIVCINKEDSNFFLQYKSNIITIPHWLNSDTKDLDIIKNDKFILFIGRNDSNKGLEHLYNLPYNKYEIHCVTNGKLLRKDFIQHINISDNDLVELYKKASVVVIPSKYEAFSLVALEAINYNTPIVISDRVRIADYLQGNKGYQIFKYHNFDEFNNAIENILGEKFNKEELTAPFKKEQIKWCEV